jgi:hypothetical protein
MAIVFRGNDLLFCAWCDAGVSEDRSAAPVTRRMRMPLRMPAAALPTFTVACKETVMYFALV